MVCQPHISVFFHRSLCSWLVTLHIAWICRLRPTSRINEIRPGSSIVVDFGIANHPRAHFLHISKLYHVRRDVSRFAVFVSEKKIGNLQIGSISDVARDIMKSKYRWVFCLHGPRPARPWKTYAWCIWWMVWCPKSFLQRCTNKGCGFTAKLPEKMKEEEKMF